MLLQAAQAAAGGQQYPAGVLYVVATPIGNLADISLRAVHVLALVDAIACEDTRHSSALLRHLGIDKPLLAVHEHNEREAADVVLARLQRGERVAYVSDAGTPAISDPGAVLVAQLQAAGVRCIPLPGASSALAAVSVAGDAIAAGFVFNGFMPTRGAERTQAIERLAREHRAQVVFEAPHRIESLLTALAAASPERQVTLCRELTKQFETVVTLPASQLPTWLAEDPNRERGEFVLVVHAVAQSNEDAGISTHDTTLAALLAELPMKQAVALAAKITHAPRNALYARALELKNENAG